MNIFSIGDWQATKSSIYAKTERDVQIALQKNIRDLEDFKALISPAAVPYLAQMAALSQHLTRKRFGKNHANVCTHVFVK